MANVNDIKNLYLHGAQVSALYLGDVKLWPLGIPVGTTFNFDYTGTVQSIELPPGKYKLQCWGAQGGTSYGNKKGIGSNGGYSEGVLTLTETTTLYVFVGGKGSNGSDTNLVNGGWNGGGASVGHLSYYNYSQEIEADLYPACGGGATDICTVTSSMNYSNGRTNRSNSSLLSRIIVAGGGAGGAEGNYYTANGNLVTKYSDQSQQGGGTNGKGRYPGTQSSAGTGGGFGYGGNQENNNCLYCSGGAGGGWYGGGTSYSNSSSSYINYTGGGSGFVNIAANASLRPSGYTGLQLDNGTTIAGDTSHPSISGGTEMGHSGNGYAKIIAIDNSGSSEEEGTTVNISWAVQTGSWTEESNSSAMDGKQFTSVSPGDNGSTILRCTFSGITSITFNCVYNGEKNYDYLTVGDLDSTCTRNSYGTTLKETSGTAKDIIFSCDSGTHYVEFCYSKDNSVNILPDCATVYIKSYS